MPNWRDVLDEIHRFQVENQADPTRAHQAVDVIRRQYLLRLHEKTGRNIIAYYSGFLSKPSIFQSAIGDEDKNGFMMAVHGLERNLGLDLILHTQGGSIAATESLVNYLRKMFGDNMRAVIPQIAMSAGTMLACSCKSILMGKQSNLGPIDPHVRDIPTYGVLQEFKRAYREVKRDPSKLVIWQSIISQYRPTFLGQCENAVQWSNSFVKEQLETIMFAGDRRPKDKATKVVRALSNYTINKVHNRHIHAEECEKIGLTVEHLEAEGGQELQDLVLTVHHCFMHTIMNTPCYKIIENHKGVALVKREQVQGVLVPQQFFNPNP
jgi:serine dehydrogenase proteinase